MRLRKRHPLDVPTPIAVALADFCRRAGAVTDPRSVRDALSLVDASLDARVLELAGDAPAMKPLGPFAVIDMLDGMTPQDAARRQREGRYELVAIGDLADAPPPPPSPSPPRPEAEAEAPGPKKRRSRKAKAAAVAERIAPVKRAPRSFEPPAEPPAPPPEKPSAWRKRELPKGRGRFTKVDATKARASKLLQPHKREELEALVTQHGHRIALWKVLSMQYTAMNGENLTLEDVEAALARHRLRTVIAIRERELLIGAMTDAQGSRFRAAGALGIEPGELDYIALNIGVDAELDIIREHHAREALAHGNLRRKLEMLERGKYLADLGVELRFRDALALELNELLERHLKGKSELKELVTAAARAEGLDAQKLRRAMDQTGLSAQYASRLAP
jgi:hypothetical protein